MPPTVAHIGAERPRDPLARIICIGNSVELITSARLAGHSQPNSPISAPEAEVVDITGLSSGNSHDTRRELGIYPPTGKCTSDYKLGWLQIVLQPHDQAPEYGSSDGADDYRDWYLLQVPMKQLAKYRKPSKRRPRARRLRIEKQGEIGSVGKRAPVQARQAVAWLLQSPHANGHPVATILIYAKPDLSNLMQDIPNSTPWTEMALAGTHDSAAFYGVPYTQCQKGSITQQLQDGKYRSAIVAGMLLDRPAAELSGIRYLDLRIKVVGDDLILYHGPVSQRAKFTAILSEIYAFLRAHPSESLLITLKEEIPPNDPNFGRMVWEAIEPGDRAGYWYRQPRVPSLGEVRGKAILMSRFAGGKEWEAGIGWAPAWPNDRKESETELTGDGSVFRLQDWYDIGLGAMQEKADAVTSILDTTLTDSIFPTSLTKPPYTLTLSYASGGSIPFAPPCTIACGLGFPSWGMGMWGINHRLVDWLLDLIAFDSVDSGRLNSVAQSSGGTVRRVQPAARGQARAGREGRLRRIRGILALDFYEDQDGQGSAIVELMALMNEAGLDRTVGVKSAREEDEEDDLEMEDESGGS